MSNVDKSQDLNLDRFVATFLLILILFFHNSGYAQQVTGNLQGRLLDSLRHPVADANVAVKGPNLQGTRTVSGDDRGYFTILALPPGDVSVGISCIGYQQLNIEYVAIQLGKTTHLGEIQLHSRTHELPEVIVTGNKPLIDPSSTSSGGNIRATEFTRLPVDRNYRRIISLLPQANTSYFGDEVNFGGATGLENKYFVDGVEVTAANRGETGTNLPYNFIKEIEVRTGGYEAEYRSALGGIVNVITPSGGNEFHASAFGFYTSNQLAAYRRVGTLDPSQGGFSDYDIGINIGGPIVRDKLWFFAAYNPTFARRDVDVPGYDISVDKTLTQSFAGKLTWMASPKVHLVLTATGDPSERQAVGDVSGAPRVLANPDPYFTDIKGDGINLSARGTYALSDHILIDASISRISRREYKQPSTERGKNEVLFKDVRPLPIIITWSGGVEVRTNNFSYGTNVSFSVTAIAGSHLLKGGIEYKDIESDKDVEAHTIVRDTDVHYIREDYSYPGITTHNRIPSIFLQETWQVLHNLSLSMGMRWDAQFLVGSDGKVAQEITDQFQPRVGFAFQTDEDGTQRIFGSYGRFSQELSNYISTVFHADKGYHYKTTYDHDPRVDTSGATYAINQPSVIMPAVQGLKGQYFDEFSIGFERLIGKRLKVSVEGVYRTLREAIEDVLLPGETSYRYGNPGRGLLSDFPKAQRDYTALVFTVQQSAGDDFNFFASYVLSRTYGNYTGLYDSFNHRAFPNDNNTFDSVSDLKGAAGLLPNDRTHSLKFSGSYNFGFGLIAGTSFSWQSGTPLDMKGGTTFLVQRGTAGRTPSIWDLNLRFTYSLPRASMWDTHLILDILHIASQREPVDIGQVLYLSDPAKLFANYGLAFRYQPPMSARLGLEVSF